MSNMCWCKDCKWFEDEVCVNDKSDNCCDFPGKHNSCEQSESKKTTDLYKALFILLYDGYDMPDVSENDKDETFVENIIYALIQKNEKICPFKNYSCEPYCENNKEKCLSDSLEIDCGTEEFHVWKNFINIEEKR